MAFVTPYRSLSVDQRVRLIAHDAASSRESRQGYAARILARGGGFRAATLKKWTPEQLAKEMVRFNLETAYDELNLLQLLYVELEPGLQAAFLDFIGMKHENGRIPDDLEPPFADEATVRGAATKLVAQHGEDGLRYLRTIAMYNGQGAIGSDECHGRCFRCRLK
jgi:hypothetical protein